MVGYGCHQNMVVYCNISIIPITKQKKTRVRVDEQFRTTLVWSPLPCCCLYTIKRALLVEST